MAQLDDVITYLEMKTRPVLPRIPAPHVKLALIRVENCTVSFYRYLYETVGTPWLWYERRLLDDETLGYYQQAGFEVYARRPLRFEDPRIRGFLPRSLRHPRLPPLD